MCFGLIRRETWRSLAAEFLGTLFFVFASCSSSLMWGTNAVYSVSPHSSLTVGLSYAAVVQCTKELSGGHFNPAITVACFLTDKLNCCKAFGYVLSQLAGGLVGAALLLSVSPSSVQGTLGTPSVASDVTVFQAFVLELILTSLFVFVIFTVNFTTAKQSQGYGIPLAIGLALTVCHYVGGPHTGCGVNPARALAPAAISGTWTNHWVYWIGPLLGASLAGVLYEVILPPSERIRKHTRNYHKRMTAILVLLVLVTAMSCVAVAS